MHTLRPGTLYYTEQAVRHGAVLISSWPKGADDQCCGRVDARVMGAVAPRWGGDEFHAEDAFPASAVFALLSATMQMNQGACGGHIVNSWLALLYTARSPGRWCHV